MIHIFDQGIRRAKKEHQCFNCYRPIAPGTEYSFGTYKWDYVYTIKSHIDCESAAWFHFERTGFDDFGEGYPPLLDNIMDGDGQYDIDALRGHYPHVACRLEYATTP